MVYIGETGHLFSLGTGYGHIRLPCFPSNHVVIVCYQTGLVSSWFFPVHMSVKFYHTHSIDNVST